MTNTPEASLAVAEALKPCPFCGGAATMECIGEDGSARWSAGCSADVESCMAYQSLTSFARRSDAVKAWNTRATPTDTSAGERGIVQPSIATKPTSSRTEASATETDDRRIEHLRVQALGAALSRRDWSAAERAYEAIRDAFDMLPANVKTDPRHRPESTPPAVLAAPPSSTGERMREALEESKHWHERQDKALSKSGRGDADYYYRRSLHREEIDRIATALDLQGPGKMDSEDRSTHEA